MILHLNEAAGEYLEPHKVERVVRDHSGAIAVPIKLVDAPEAEARSLSEGTALWAKPKSAVTAEEYKEFYQNLASQFDEPALTIHWRAEGRHEYTVLGFVPGSRPFDLFDPGRKGKAKLYVRRVLISQDAEILPNWLRFMRLVVDSADLPLNVSRELIQESAVFAAIKKGVTNRVVQELTKFAESDGEGFDKVWENFGSVLKEGLYEDPERRDAIYKFTRFVTSTHPDGKRTLADYVAAMKENQTEIYYLLGEDLKRLQSSPQLEGFRARGLEVLMLPDPIDAFWIGNSAGYEGKRFKSVSQGAADLKNIPAGGGQGGAVEGDQRRAGVALRPDEGDPRRQRRGRARLRPAGGEPRLPRRAGPRPRPAPGADAGRARPAWPGHQAGAGDQRRPPAHHGAWPRRRMAATRMPLPTSCGCCSTRRG